jgi:hypothetical protein
MRGQRIVGWPRLDSLVDGRRKPRGWWRSVTGVWTWMVPARLACACRVYEGSSNSARHVPFPMECSFSEKIVTRNFTSKHVLLFHHFNFDSARVLSPLRTFVINDLV